MLKLNSIYRRPVLLGNAQRLTVEAKLCYNAPMQDELQITLTNDFAFKFFLGSEENKPILQDLLQCILGLSVHDVSDIELMDKELTKAAL